MSIITSQNWDSVVRPAIPSGWTVSSGLITTALFQVSTPNALGASASNFSGTAAAMWATADPSGGDVVVQASMYFGSGGSLNRWGLFARSNKNPTNASSIFYTLWLKNATATDSPTLSITISDHGQETPLTGATVAIGTPIQGGWYTPYFLLSGTSLQGSLQRVSDGYWLASNGSWQATQTQAISIIDGEKSGSGYAGLLLDGAVAGTMYSDDFVLLTAPTSIDLSIGAGILSTTGAIATTTVRADTSLAIPRFAYSGVLSVVNTGLGFTSIVPPIASTASLLASPIVTQEQISAANAIAANGIIGSLSLLGDRFLSAFELGSIGSLAAVSTSLGTSTQMGFLGASASITTPLVAFDFMRAAGQLAAIGGFGDTFTLPQETNVIDVITLPATGALPTSNVWINHGGVAYNLYRNDGKGSSIDYANPVATTSETTWISDPLAYPGDWKFGVRASHIIDGLEEKNLDVAASLVLDASGVDVSRCPPAPSGLRAFPRAAGVIRVEWGYHQINRSRLPDGFRIYLGVGPQPDYSSPAASVPHVLARTAYVSDLIGLAPGAIYSIGVRAFNGSGEETNTVTSLAISDATGPDGVDSLMALPTATQGD